MRHPKRSSDTKIKSDQRSWENIFFDKADKYLFYTEVYHRRSPQLPHGRIISFFLIMVILDFYRRLGINAALYPSRRSSGSVFIRFSTYLSPRVQICHSRSKSCAFQESSRTIRYFSSHTADESSKVFPHLLELDVSRPFPQDSLLTERDLLFFDPLFLFSAEAAS